jgi:large subunit ribosomal protein L7/L12
LFYPEIIANINSGNFDTAREMIRKAISWEPENALHYYNLACIEARAGNSAIALSALQNSVDLGFNDIELINKDTDLDSIRKDPAFRKMYQIIASNNLANKVNGGPEVAEIYKLEKEKGPVVTVHLVSLGDQKIAVIKEVRAAIPNLGLKDAKDLVEKAPVNIAENFPKDQAETLKLKLEAVGAKVEIK